jgi:membrane carboxypeptidase/penicillin-binding protein PbpC
VIALALRTALSRARVSRAGIVASALGAAAACAAIALVSPLSLAGGARVEEAAASFREDLARYRAAPDAVRSAALVSAAAAGYEDRGFFSRPRWVPPLSPTGIARAVARNLRGASQGGSTIPQQLAKLYVRGEARPGVLDKLGEALFATWLVREAEPAEIAALYLNLSAGTAMGTARRPADGLHRLSLALFGLPLRRLSREDQLVLGASPRGVQWLRAHPCSRRTGSRPPAPG